MVIAETFKNAHKKLSSILVQDSKITLIQWNNNYRKCI